jgi:hypothetical protein
VWTTAAPMALGSVVSVAFQGLCFLVTRRGRRRVRRLAGAGGW